GRLLAAVGGIPGKQNMQGEVTVWEVATGKEVRSFAGHAERVGTVAWSPDGRMLATGSGDRTLRLWEVASGAERAKFAHGGWVRSVAFSPDGRHVAAASPAAPCYVWDVFGRST